MTMLEFYTHPETRTKNFTPKTIYVSTDGDGDGSEGDPYGWDTMLLNLGAGTTVILKDGDYQNVNCVFNSRGVSGNPITFRPENKGAVKIGAAGNFTVNGDFYTFKNLEIYSYYYSVSEIDRFTQTTQPSDIGIHGRDCKIQSCVLHNFGNFGNWTPAINALIDSCLILDMGRGNGSLGHSQYIQNLTGVKNIRRSVFMVNYESSFCLHMYGSGGSNLVGCHYNDNVFVGGRNLMGSAGTKVEGAEFKTNWVINGNIELGLLGPTDKAHEFDIQDNVLLDSSMNGKRAGFITYTGNQVTPAENSGYGNLVNVDAGDIQNNTYRFYGSIPVNRFNINYVVGNLAAIVAGTDFEDNSTETLYPSSVPPDSSRVILLEDDGCIVVIANYSEAESVDVDLTGLLDGDYRAFNAQNYTEYFDFTMSGSSVSFAMTGWTKSVPYATDGGAMNQSAKPLIFPKFGVFYVRSI